jgi:hypothetical protein
MMPGKLCKAGAVDDTSVLGMPISQNTLEYLLGNALFRYAPCFLLRLASSLFRGQSGRAASSTSFAVILVPIALLESSILDKADELQAKRREALEQLDGLTQAMFLDMFGDLRPIPSGPHAIRGQGSTVPQGSREPHHNSQAATESTADGFGPVGS